MHTTRRDAARSHIRLRATETLVPVRFQRAASGLVITRFAHTIYPRVPIPAANEAPWPCLRMLGGARLLHAADRKRTSEGGVEYVLLNELETDHVDVGERSATCDTRERTAGGLCHCAVIDMGMSARERAGGQHGVFEPAHTP